MVNLTTKLIDIRDWMVYVSHKVRENAELEVFLIYVVAGLGVLLRNVVYATVWRAENKPFVCTLLFDFVCLVVPMVLVQTILGDHVFETVTFFVALILVLVITFYRRLISNAQWNGVPLSAVETNQALNNSNTWYRSMVLITTTVAILAVDFPIFPNRFYKTRAYGHSLMDTGTAAFIFISGLSDFRATIRYGNRIRTPCITILSVSIPSIFVLLILGLGRTISLKLFSYHQNIAEYGAHWNFFVTLFFLRLYVWIIGYRWAVPLGLLIGILYQLVLSFTDLEHWIVRLDVYPRVGFIDENREGIFSLFGYAFLYSLAMIYARVSSHVLLKKEHLSLFGIFIGLGLAVFSFCLHKLIEICFKIEPSRRLANLPYAFSMAALFSVSVSGLQLFNYFIPAPTFRGSARDLSEAISRNGLVYFLIANVITGIVNMLNLPGEYVSGELPETTFLIFYSLTLCVIISYMNSRR
ncbi:GWT1 domain-containing protein [Ditylenchus destructor]|nr:GWT1 domain-containing protein [Ditylenchus destructor]